MKTTIFLLAFALAIIVNFSTANANGGTTPPTYTSDAGSISYVIKYPDLIVNPSCWCGKEKYLGPITIDDPGRDYTWVSGVWPFEKFTIIGAHDAKVLNTFTAWIPTIPSATVTPWCLDLDFLIDDSDCGAEPGIYDVLNAIDTKVLLLGHVGAKRKGYAWVQAGIKKINFNGIMPAQTTPGNRLIVKLKCTSVYDD